MAIEIERRFLVTNEKWRIFAGIEQPLRQGYLIINNQGWSVRIRIHAQEKGWITLKALAKGPSNNEFEYMIPIEDAESLWDLTSHRVFKSRYALKIENANWVVDCFKGENTPLVLAEVELHSENQLVDLPDWCGREITGEFDWSNAALAKNPIQNWPIEKLRSNGLTQKNRHIVL